jgi:acetyltransferase-like isoleucine patch superfamily enzyme
LFLCSDHEMQGNLGRKLNTMNSTSPVLGNQSYLRQDGWYLFACRVVQAGARRLRNALLQRRLGTSGLNIGKDHRLVGLAHMRIGRGLTTGSHLWLEAVAQFAGESFSPLLTIGDDCNLSDSVHIACTNRITIGSGLLSGSRVVISDHTHGLYRGPKQTSPNIRPVMRPLSRDGVVVIGNNVWLGDGVAVLAGADIGDGCVVGANSVVNRCLPPRTLCVGAPARPVRQWDEASGTWQRIDKPC